MTEPLAIHVYALSVSDALGYRGQNAVADAMVKGSDYRIIGGHMVRLLLHVYPTAAAVARSTTDADTAIGSLEVAAPLAQNFFELNFTKQGGNLFYREVAPEQRIEVNLLAPRTGLTRGVKPKFVPGVGQIDTLPELTYVFNHEPLILNVEAELSRSETIAYQTRIPNVEEAMVLKAHAWRERQSEKDLADLYSLLEIREAHPEVPWRLHEATPMGFRKDTAEILQTLRDGMARKRTAFAVPTNLNRSRFAALIAKHVTRET